MSGFADRIWNLVALAVVVYFGVEWLRTIASPWAVVAIVLAVASLPFILCPVLIHRTQWTSLDPGLVPFNPDGPGSPEVLRSHFAATAAGLDRVGFTPARYYRTKLASANADAAVLLFWNEKTWETARVLTAASKDSLVATSFTVFCSEFSDGTEVVTSNRESARSFPSRKPPYHGRAFPQVHEIGQLLAVHRARVENLAAGRIAVDPVAGDPDGYIRRVDFEVPFAHHVACGYTYVDEMARVQRMTWKGAILSTWKLMPPIKQVRLAWERMAAARELRSLKAGERDF